MKLTGGCDNDFTARGQAALIVDHELPTASGARPQVATGGAVICTPPCIILAMMYSPHKTSSGASRAQRAGQGRDPGARGHRRQQLPRRQHPAAVRDGAPGRRGERGPERELLLAVVVDLRCPLA